MIGERATKAELLAAVVITTMLLLQMQHAVVVVVVDGACSVNDCAKQCAASYGPFCKDLFSFMFMFLFCKGLSPQVTKTNSLGEPKFFKI
jgi:hypothetical protein